MSRRATARRVVGPVGDKHHVTAFRIDPASGGLTPHGEPIPLPTRPIHMTSDIPSAHLLVAFSNPSAMRVYRVNPDATLGEEVRQTGTIDPGIYGHQVRVSPDNRLAILVARDHDAAAGKPEEPGALKVFRYQDGQLSGEVSVAPNRGIRLRAAPPRFSSLRALGLCIARKAEQARHVPDRRATRSPPIRNFAGNPGRARATSAEGRPRAPCTSIRMGALSTR